MQVHGHDFSCVCSIPNPPQSKSGSSRLYASGSEEKVIRVLEAPQAFLQNLSLIRGERVEASASTSGQVPPPPTSPRPLHLLPCAAASE